MVKGRAKAEHLKKERNPTGNKEGYRLLLLHIYGSHKALLAHLKNDLFKQCIILCAATADLHHS